MKHLKMLGLAAVAAMALTAFAASSASATTGEVGGVTKNESLKVSATLATGTSAVLSRTDGSLANTCTSASGSGSTESPFTGTSVGGAIGTGSVGGCTEAVTIDNVGTIWIQHVSGTTNGTVFSANDEITVKTPFGSTVNCRTTSGVDVGLLTGKASGQATVDVNAVLNCGFLLPSATLKATISVTSPEGAGVSA